MIHGSLWDPPDEVRGNVGKYIEEVSDVMSYSVKCQNWGCIRLRGVETRREMAVYYLPAAAFYETFAGQEGFVGVGGGNVGWSGYAEAFEYFGFMMKRRWMEDSSCLRGSSNMEFEESRRYIWCLYSGRSFDTRNGKA
jgi:hypothetical protein